MNSTQPTQPQPLDRFGRQVAARLNAGTAELPYEITERLRAARMQAVAQRKRAAALRMAPTVSGNGANPALTLGNERQSIWNRIASVLPILALAAGLIVIHTFENDRRASEVAEVDAALLTDDLPPAAYADPGFIQFLKQSGKE